MSEEGLSILETAEALGVSDTTIRRAITRGIINAYRVLGQDWKVPPSGLNNITVVTVGPSGRDHLILPKRDGIRYRSVEDYAEEHDMTQRAVRRYLGLGRIKGIKPEYARSWVVVESEG